MMEPLTALAFLGPVIQHGLSALINKWTGMGGKPVTVDDAVKLGDLEIRKLEALAKMDEVAGTSQWVADLRGTLRPGATILVLAAFVILVLDPTPNLVALDIAANVASTAMFYIFGERTMLYVKRSGK